MQLSKKAIDEFREIFRKEFGEELSDNEASTRATNFLELFSLIYKPVRKNPQNAKK